MVTTGAEIQWVPPNLLDRLDPAAVFGRRAPLELEVGCGDGRFLVARAAAHPGTDFLGIERLLGRVRTVCRRAARAGLGNIRVLRLESSYAVRYLLPAGSLAAAHLLFPDPWPKRRHHPRRIFNAPFAASLCDALSPGAPLFVKTDDAGYFAAIRSVAACEPRLAADPTPFPEDYPITGFERHYLEQGRTIHAARFIRVDPERGD